VPSEHVSKRRDRIAAQFEQNHANRLQIGDDGIVVGAAPYRLDGSATHAVLLVHGFNDTPQSVAPLARALHVAGWTVVAPLLPGHGRSLPVMAAESRADAWLACVRSEYVSLRASHGTVALCGLSMGGALCALLAAEHPEVPALVLMAPYLGMSWGWQAKLMLAWGAMLFTPYLKGSGGERSIHDPEARARALGPGVNTAHTLTGLRTIALAAESALPALRTPTLYLQSREDNRVTTADAERHFARLGSAVREQRWLTGCGHIITADYCRDEVAAQVIAWLSKHVRGGIGNA
jgi:carboxylesterase